MKFYKIEKEQLREKDLAIFKRLYPLARDLSIGNEIVIPLSADYDGENFVNGLSVESIECVGYALHAAFNNLLISTRDAKDSDGHVYDEFIMTKTKEDFKVLFFEKTPKSKLKRPSSNSSNPKNNGNKNGNSNPPSNNETNGNANPPSADVVADNSKMATELTNLLNAKLKLNKKDFSDVEKIVFDFLNKNFA